jgi:Protein of unknown function (DUF2786)
MQHERQSCRDDANGEGVMTDVVEKVRKLLRLARDGGATENEAAVAMAMAQRLMLEHDIKDVEEKRHIDAVLGAWMECERGEGWEIIVAQAVAKLFNCRSAVRRGAGSHQFVGKPENIEICGDTFLWVCAQVEVFYKHALKEYGGRLDRRGRAELRRTFKDACALRIFHRVAEIVAKARNEIPAHMALVVVDQSLSEADDVMNGAGYTTGRGIRPKTGLGTGAGMRAGDNVQLQRKVK